MVSQRMLYKQLVEPEASGGLRVAVVSIKLEFRRVIPLDRGDKRFRQILGIFEKNIDNEMRSVVTERIAFDDVFLRARWDATTVT